MRATLLPLGIYLGVTLGIPLANGAGAHEEFRHHAAEVIAVTTLLVALRVLRLRFESRSIEVAARAAAVKQRFRERRASRVRQIAVPGSRDTQAKCRAIASTTLP